jgi:Uma2 family endonuclease
MLQADILHEDERFELIEGEIVPMSPKGNQHEVIKSGLNVLIARHIPDDLRLGVETSVYLSMTTFVEPDLCLYPKRILPEDARGTDIALAIEVAGASLGYDRGAKARLYARHGVCELWVIDAETRTTWVHKEPKVDGTWGSLEERSANATLTTDAVPGFAVKIGELR